ncbi:uncharacterized protein UTRI_10421_B [Ustilago trichophora]|uniref:Uncharacterized protein n=1 Tax=Ustilago trichophora TaxID=86804 RepID=A0A5C3E8S4_9BASI|nr:uncharacterized protein UTRI_10421_B [Ustilago trichophora]
MPGLKLRSLLLLCITLMLTASFFAAGTELSEDDELAHQRLQDRLIEQLGLVLPRKDVFESLDLQFYKNKYHNFAARLDGHARHGYRIFHIRTASPSRSVLPFRRYSRVHVNWVTYYMSFIQPQNRLGSPLGLRDPDNVFDADPTHLANRGKRAFAFWKHENNQKHLLAVDLFPHNVRIEHLDRLSEVIPGNWFAEIH